MAGLATVMPRGSPSSKTDTLLSVVADAPALVLLSRTVTVDRPPDCTMLGEKLLAAASAGVIVSEVLTGPGLEAVALEPSDRVSVAVIAPAGRLLM